MINQGNICIYQIFFLPLHCQIKKRTRTGDKLWQRANFTSKSSLPQRKDKLRTCITKVSRHISAMPKSHTRSSATVSLTPRTETRFYDLSSNTNMTRTWRVRLDVRKSLSRWFITLRNLRRTEKSSQTYVW